MIINGKIYWAKVIGPAVENKFGQVQWSFDLAISEETVEMLTKKGVPAGSIRNKFDDRGDFLTFTRDSVKKDGSAGKPYRVVNAQDEPWGDQKIGNGSEVNVVVSLNEREFRGKKFLKPSAIAIQVWELVPYESGKFPTKETSSEVSSQAETEW